MVQLIQNSIMFRDFCIFGDFACFFPLLQMLPVFTPPPPPPRWTGTAGAYSLLAQRQQLNLHTAFYSGSPLEFLSLSAQGELTRGFLSLSPFETVFFHATCDWSVPAELVLAVAIPSLVGIFRNFFKQQQEQQRCISPQLMQQQHRSPMRPTQTGPVWS